MLIVGVGVGGLCGLVLLCGFVTLRSRIRHLESDAFLCHTRIASLIRRVETLEREEGLDGSWHERAVEPKL